MKDMEELLRLLGFGKDVDSWKICHDTGHQFQIRVKEGNPQMVICKRCPKEWYVQR